MAIWGAKLYESDSTSDIRDAFLKLIGNGLSPNQAKQQILNAFSESFSDLEEKDGARLALADQLFAAGVLSEGERVDILSFLEAGGDIPFWEENAPHLVECRRKELKRLETQFRQPPASKAKRKSSTKQFSWEMGQVYAIPIHDASADVLGIQGEFILLYFYSEAEPINGYRIPLAWAKLTQNGKLPGNATEFNRLPYIQISCTAMEERFHPFARQEDIPLEYAQEDIPLEYAQEYIPDAWRYLEEYILQGYRLHNLHQAAFNKK